MNGWYNWPKNMIHSIGVVKFWKFWKSIAVEVSPHCKEEILPSDGMKLHERMISQSRLATIWNCFTSYNLRSTLLTGLLSETSVCLQTCVQHCSCTTFTRKYTLYSIVTLFFFLMYLSLLESCRCHPWYRNYLNLECFFGIIRVKKIERTPEWSYVLS